MIIFLSISLNMCFGCSKEPSHRDGSFEYPQHMFWLRNKKKKNFSYTLVYECEGGIEKSVLRSRFSITRHAKLCHLHTKDGFFSCSPFNSAFLFDIKLLDVSG